MLSENPLSDKEFVAASILCPRAGDCAWQSSPAGATVNTPYMFLIQLAPHSHPRPSDFLLFCAAGLLCFQMPLAKAQGTEAPIIQPGAPGQPSRTLPPGTSGVPTPISPADVSFMQGMVMHHGQAVEMCALIASHTHDAQVISIGQRISLSQADEMRFMQRWLTDRHEPTSMAMPGMPDMTLDGSPMPAMPGMLTAEQMTTLRAARGPAFDYLFLTGMVQHHGGALVMVKDLFAAPASGQDADLFNFATDVDNTQRAEIRIMQSLLTTHPAPTMETTPAK